MPNNTVQLKTCTKCKSKLPLTEYYKNKNMKDGLMGQCKSCSKKYCNINKKKIEKSRKEKYQKIKHDPKYIEKRRDYGKQWRAKNRERLNREYKEKYANDSLYRKKVISGVLKRSEKHKQRLKEKYDTDIAFKIKCCLRARFYELVKDKSESIIHLVGCSIDDLLKHLQKQFVEGMTWDNHGEWHIDHIIPCASFNLTEPEQQKKCFHYTNLQPLWASDNISKGAKLPE